jgi:hypothetical protein
LYFIFTMCFSRKNTKTFEEKVKDVLSEKYCDPFIINKKANDHFRCNETANMYNYVVYMKQDDGNNIYVGNSDPLTELTIDKVKYEIVNQYHNNKSIWFDIGKKQISLAFIEKCFQDLCLNYGYVWSLMTVDKVTKYFCTIIRKN